MTKQLSGIRELRRWLENIESRAKDAPIIIVGTHIDLLPSSHRQDVLEEAKKHIKNEYLVPSLPNWAFKGLHKDRIYFVNTKDENDLNSLREAIYNFVLTCQFPMTGMLYAYIVVRTCCQWVTVI